MRVESFADALRMGFQDMWRIVENLAGAWSARTRHSSSRKTMFGTQCRLFSIAQWLRATGSSRSGTIDVRKKRISHSIFR